MASRFEMLPPELIEVCVSFLSFSDICSFRSVSRTICAKSSAGSFQNLFLHKRIHIKPSISVIRSFFYHTPVRSTKNSLRRFARLTSRSSLCRQVQSLTICGIINIGLLRSSSRWGTMLDAASEQNAIDLADFQNQLALLSEALLNLGNSTTGIRLRKITLTVETEGLQPEDSPSDPRLSHPKDIRQQTWQVAASTFELVMQALEASRTSCESLDVFSSIERCGLYHDHFAAWLRSQHWTGVLLRLKHLEVSLVSPAQSDAMGSTGAATVLQPRLTQLFASATQLETLQVHWYKLPRATWQTETTREARAEDLLLKDLQLDAPVALSRALTACTLQGLYTATLDLLAFLRLMPALRELCIERLILDKGTAAIQDVFDLITRGMDRLQTLVLSDIYAPLLIKFDDPSATPSKHITAEMLGRVGAGQRLFAYNTLQRHGAGIRDDIRWSLDDSARRDTVAAKFRTRSMWQKYG